MKEKHCEKCGAVMETEGTICKACEYKLRYGINNRKRYYAKRNYKKR